jgi:hypothetical protein
MAEDACAHNAPTAILYHPGLGVCGEVNTDADRVVAIAPGLFDGFNGGNSNHNTHLICGEAITINCACLSFCVAKQMTTDCGTVNGESTTATVVDECTSCAEDSDIDMSGGVLKSLGVNPEVGQITVSWHF